MVTMMMMMVVVVVDDVLIVADRSRIRESGYFPARSSPRGRNKRSRSVSSFSQSISITLNLFFQSHPEKNKL